MNTLLKTTVLTLALWLTLMQNTALAGEANHNTQRLGLRGYSPVSYFEHDRPHFGSPEFQSAYEGVTYLFASQAELDRFKHEPAKYAPAYGGWCAYGMAVEGKFDVDPTNYEIEGGRLLVFLRNDEVDTRELWNQGTVSELIDKADAYWSTVSE